MSLVPETLLHDCLPKLHLHLEDPVDLKSSACNPQNHQIIEPIRIIHSYIIAVISQAYSYITGSRIVLGSRIDIHIYLHT